MIMIIILNLNNINYIKIRTKKNEHLTVSYEKMEKNINYYIFISFNVLFTSHIVCNNFNRPK